MLIGEFARLARTYGFREMETPLIERSSVFARALGATSDVISSELFHVAGRGDLVLRPEGTAAVARAVAAAGGTRAISARGARLWYGGPMFRHERPQRLRLRQFTQLGAEIIGARTLCDDVDIISFCAAFVWQAPGSKDATLALNTLGAPEDRIRFNEALATHLKPRYWALSTASRARVDVGNCMRVLDSTLAEDRDALQGAPRLADFVSMEEMKRFEKLQKRLDEEHVPFKVNPTLVRGLDYYTSTAFEFVRNGRAVAAGGRYAGVHGMDGVGFAIGLERVEHPPLPPAEAANVLARDLAGAVAVLPVGAADPEAHSCPVGATARRITRQLRDAGVPAVARLENVKLSKLISRAIRAGAAALVVVGAHDIAAGSVKVKVIDHSRPNAEFVQHDVPLDEIGEFCQRLGGCGGYLNYKAEVSVAPTAELVAEVRNKTN